MILKEVSIFKYKCIEQTQRFNIEDDITILVGMNESGKTSILEAIAKANYFQDDVDFEFDTTHDYPRKEKKEMDKKGESPIAIQCKYYISDDLYNTIKNDLGKDIIVGRELSITTKYDNKAELDGIIVDRKSFLNSKLKEVKIYSKTLAEKLYSANSLTEYNSIKNEYVDKNILKGLNELEYLFKNNQAYASDNIDEYIFQTYIKPRLPKFLYYDEYYALPSRISIERLNSSNPSSGEFKTAKALFELAQIDTKELVNAKNFEDYKAELEATESIISSELFKYWSTNQNIEIVFDIDKIPDSSRIKIIEHVLDIRVRNKRVGMSLPLKNRSKGFNWFFSFLVWFKKIQEDANTKYILLLDEPGLNLHASAQADLLKFIKDLSSSYQIIYTTHSPFMIESGTLHKVRTVVETNIGSIVSDSIQEKDSKTLFPLQAALGYDIAQNLFISKNNLLVEGVSDLVYLQLLSSLLEMKGRTHLSEKITIIPVGGLDKVSVFISLLGGSELNIVCLLDSSIDNNQKLKNLVSSKLIEKSKILLFNDFLENVKEADIEDLFSKRNYIDIFNRAFKGHYDSITFENLNPSIPRIVNQISTYLEISRFNHYRPANELSKNQDLLNNIEESAFDKFENIFKKVNKMLVD